MFAYEWEIHAQPKLLGWILRGFLSWVVHCTTFKLKPLRTEYRRSQGYIHSGVIRMEEVVLGILLAKDINFISWNETFSSMAACEARVEELERRHEVRGMKGWEQVLTDCIRVKRED